MPKEKRSFFERLTGTVSLEDEQFNEREAGGIQRPSPTNPHAEERGQLEEEETGEGQLTVDVYHNNEAIIIKALVAGVRPEDLDISITRDMVTVRGKREEINKIPDENYFNQELYWGSFSRTILLPQEVDVELSEKPANNIFILFINATGSSFSVTVFDLIDSSCSLTVSFLYLTKKTDGINSEVNTKLAKKINSNKNIPTLSKYSEIICFLFFCGKKLSILLAR